MNLKPKHPIPIDLVLIFLFLSTAASFGRERLMHHYDMEDGLSQAVATCLAQDKQGYLWAGTRAGLNRFDGERFRTFGVRDGLVSDNINTLLPDGRGRLWIGTREGMNFWDGREIQGVSALNGIDILDLELDDQHRVWCATGQGIFRQEGNGWIQLGKGDGLAREQCRVVEFGAEGMWVGTTKGVYRWQDDEFRRHSDPWTSEQSVLDLLEDNEGRLWVTTAEEVRVYNGRTIEDAWTSEQLGATVHGEIFQDRHGEFWLGTDRGVLNIKNDEFDLIADTEMPLYIVHCIFEDRDGIIWFGGTPGVISLTGRAFINYGEGDGLGTSGIRALWLDDDGVVWAGVLQVGLARYGQDEWVIYDREAGLNHTSIVTLFRDREGKLWVGSRGGLQWFEDGAFYDDPAFSMDQMILDVDQDRDGRLWVAEAEGLYRRETNGVWQKLEAPGQVFSSGHLMIDSKGRVWVSADRGLSCWDNGKWTLYTTNHGLASNQPYGLFEDSRGHIWIGYHSSRGVTVFDGKHFKTYTTDDGLTNDAVFLLGEDHHGHMWIGTLNGVDHFDGDVFQNYGPADGFASHETNTSAFLRDGPVLWFGTMGKLIRFDHTYDMTTSEPPIFRLEEISLGGSAFSHGEEGFTDFKRSSLEARVAILSYTPRSKTRVQYRIVDYDEDWRDLEKSRFTYSRLPPGAHQLEVRARRYDGPWSEIKEFDFRVIPPIHETWWFRSLLLGVFLFLLYLVFKSRVQGVEHRAVKLEDMVREQTAELRSEIAERKRTEQELVNAQNELVEKAHQAGMADIAIGVLHNIGNLLSSVNTSATLIRQTAEKSKSAGLAQVNTLLRENSRDLGHFFDSDPKGRQLLKYLEQLEQMMGKERDLSLDNTQRLLEKIDAIRNYITMHQSYVVGGMFSENLTLAEVVDDAIALQAGSMDRHDIELVKDYQPVPKIRLQKTKLAHIIVNLFKNAKEAMADLPPEDRRISLEIKSDHHNVYLRVSDRGYGISPEDAPKMFAQGFTTKQNGHGFGLHSCANYMKEMGGEITFESTGPGQGATFILRFPIESMAKPKQNTVKRASV